MLGKWMENYSRLCYIQMYTCDEAPIIAAARQQAHRHQWDFELRKGNWALLEKLFGGQWDDDFVIVPPGGQITAVNDERILDAKNQS